MENNIFEDAKFGDKFVCKNSEIALFHHKTKAYLYFILERFNKILKYDLNGLYWYNGNCDFNIISKYQEPIDEEKLDELANEWLKEEYSDVTDCISNWEEFDNEHNITFNFKAGYRKAKE